MGLLQDDYYSQTRTQMPQVQPPPSPAAAQGKVPAVRPSLNTKPTTEQDPAVADLRKNQNPLRNIGYGLGRAMGVQEGGAAWDEMSFGAKSLAVAKAIPAAALKVLVDVPKELVKAPLRYGLTFSDAWGDVAAGKRPTQESLAAKPVREIPWLGAVPTYFQSYDEARKSGLGPLMSTVSTGSLALGDITIGASLAEGVQGAMRPRAKTVAGLPAMDTAPIRSVIKAEETGIRSVRRPTDSVSEYYSVPQDVAKKHGGSSANTFVKVTPAGLDGSMEVSLVQTRGGVLQRAEDFVRGRGEKTYRGDFGPETKIESKVVPGAPKELGAAVEEGARDKALQSVIPKPLKGFEKAPVTESQVGHLTDIVAVNGIDGEVAQAVMRSVTGKAAVGELTQAEYVTVSRTFAAMDKMNMVSDSLPGVNPLGQYLSPQRKWMRAYEEKSGGAVPLYSEAYVPMEDAMRARKIFRDQHRLDSREIFGKYAEPSYAEERRLLKSYMEGDTDAVMKNPALDATTKSELATIADRMRAKYDALGPAFGIESEYFLQNYQPHIQNIGGIYQLYKDAKGIPKEMTFFAEKKRVGSLSVQVDDALALFDIYLNAGSNKVFVNPALERINAFGDALPATLKESLKEYVGEKLGYAGKVEEYVNRIAPELNRRLGTDLPPDLGRQLTQTIMDTTYAGALGIRPAAVVRNLLQAPFMTYPRLGPRFYAQAVAKALTKEGQTELVRRGMSVDLGLPYGEELTKEITLGGRARTAHRNVTQGVLKPYALADIINRATTFWQGKAIWDDAMTRYRSGKITWDQFEQAADFQAMSPIDRNVMRKALVAGDEDAAFNHYIRDIMDDTQFPYRRGAGARVTYGFAGRVLTQFSQWNTEFAHTIGSWVRTGQWDKMIRFSAAAYATQRTLETTLGVDVTNWTGLNVLNPTASPFLQFAGEVVGLVQNLRDNNRQAMNDNRDALIRQAKALGIPGGVQGIRVGNFWKSVNAGPDAEGKYPVYSANGTLNYRADFNDLWWDVLWNFPSKDLQAKREVTKGMRNAQEDYSQAKRRALELYQQQKYDDANKLVEQFGIKIGPGDFKAYYIPYDQRLFDNLPASMKAQFAPRVYPAQ